jgi:hypothetical protein
LGRLGRIRPVRDRRWRRSFVSRTHAHVPRQGGGTIHTPDRIDARGRLLSPCVIDVNRIAALDLGVICSKRRRLGRYTRRRWASGRRRSSSSGRHVRRFVIDWRHEDSHDCSALGRVGCDGGPAGRNLSSDRIGRDSGRTPGPLDRDAAKPRFAGPAASRCRLVRGDRLPRQHGPGRTGSLPVPRPPE